MITETTPGYDIALAAAAVEGREAYVRELAIELIETAENPETRQEATP
ncbi:hypothetical protein [Streptomyces sp. NPDC056982]